ncbi:MAG TPA: hypothetical protein VNL77_20300, partial [Roseiflexaceae bacterium]|nr:hypothetical protein [Roseiflexaceae bacterium]
MRLRLQAERIARLCGIAGVLLVSGAGAAEAARWAFPAGARAAAVVYQDQPTPDPAATTAAAPPADPVAT